MGNSFGRQAHVSCVGRVSDRISIIVPVFNERATIAEVIARLRSVTLPAPRQIIVVNDGSADGTRDLLRVAGSKDGNHFGDLLRLGHADNPTLRAPRDYGCDKALIGRIVT